MTLKPVSPEIERQVLAAFQKNEFPKPTYPLTSIGYRLGMERKEAMRLAELTRWLSTP